MQGAKKFNRRHLLWILPLGLILAAALAFLVYSADYYRADPTALDSLASDGQVAVLQTDYGWFFDGPSEACALVFYPGAKVEETAYAPLMRRLAAAGMDACLVKMPLRFAFLGMNRADAVMRQHDHSRWFVGGHSLGGAIAADYAARHADGVEGLILLAAYSDARPDDRQLELVIYGTEDGLVSDSDLDKCRRVAPKNYVEHAIAGGNHAWFGNYGVQAGDGTAAISPAEQQDEAVRVIMEAVNGAARDE